MCVAAVVGATLWKLWAFTRQAFFDECGVFAARRHRPFQSASGWSVRANQPLGARRCLNLARRRHRFQVHGERSLFCFTIISLLDLSLINPSNCHLPTSRAPHYHRHHHHLISVRNRRTSPISCHAMSHAIMQQNHRPPEHNHAKSPSPHIPISPCPLFDKTAHRLCSTLLCSAAV